MAKADMKITFDEDGLEFVAKLTDKLETVCDRLESACDRLERAQEAADRVTWINRKLKERSDG